MPIITSQYNFEIDELCRLMQYEDFSPNSILTVQYGQEAVFIKDGVPVGESFLEGRHVLSSTVLDSIAESDKKIFGSSTFHTKVYFINTGRDLTLNWGTGDGGFFIEDPIDGYRFKAGAFGNYSIVIKDAKKFILKTVGQMSNNEGRISFTKFDVQDFILAKFQEVVKSAISQVVRGQNIPILDLQSHLVEISDITRQKIDENGIFANYGFSLKNFSIVNIAVSDEDYEILKAEKNDILMAKRKQNILTMEKMTDVNVEMAKERMHLQNINNMQNAYNAETQREVLTGAANNEATGQGMNLGLGLAYAQSFGRAIGGMMNNMQNNSKQDVQQVNGVECPSCHKMNPQNSMYCSSCGAKIIKEITCGKCGALNSEGSLFCQKCGSKLNAGDEQKTKCPKCGEENSSTSDFCCKCGTKLR